MTEPTPAGDVGREGSTEAVEEVGGSAGRVDLAAFDGHTPGPWEVRRGNSGKARAVLPVLNWNAIRQGTGAAEANATLIAAAPTLLAEIRALREERDALREALTEIRDDPGGHPYEEAFEDLRAIARRALPNSTPTEGTTT